LLVLYQSPIVFVYRADQRIRSVPLSYCTSVRIVATDAAREKLNQPYCHDKSVAVAQQALTEILHASQSTRIKHNAISLNLDHYQHHYFPGRRFEF
jgi:hypothetical protein